MKKYFNPKKKNIRGNIKNYRVVLVMYILLVIGILYISCGDIKEYKITSFYLDERESKIINYPFTFDSIKVYYDDSIVIRKYKSNNINETILKKNKIGMEEHRTINKDFFDDMYIRTDTLLILSNKDTSYTHYFITDNLYLVSSYSYTSCIYTFTMVDEWKRKTVKQSLIDTTYSEIYYYDKNYQISSIINTWGDNTCVYKP